MTHLSHLKVGFIGCGNMAQTIMRGWIETKVFQPGRLYASNRSEGKLKKVAAELGIVAASNEEVIEACDIIHLAMKPQDLVQAMEPLQSAFRDGQVVMSLAAGVSLQTLQKVLGENLQIVRLMPNTPLRLRQGVVGFCLPAKSNYLETLVSDLYSPLGLVIPTEEGESFTALTVACSSGVGFVFELMQYWQEWLEEYDFDEATAQSMTMQTFLGAAGLAMESRQKFLDLQARVASKKGVTSAGLDSMRELEVERALRYSFEKAVLRDKELGKK